jgi:glycosyltransferase involved in cell wall biosynthesis
MTRLRVAVNLLWCVPGVVGGTERYAVDLLNALRGRDDLALTLFATPEFTGRYPEFARHCITAPLPAGRHVVRRVAVEHSWLALRLRSGDFDVVHHLGGLVPTAPVPAVVTIHDLQYLVYPRNFSVLKRAYLRAAQGRAVRRARVVCTVSEFTGRHVRAAFPAAGRVVVIPPLLLPPPEPTDADREAVDALLRNVGTFILYPAAFYPHKNHRVLIEAFARFAHRRAVQLVFTGAAGAGAWGSARSTESEIRALAARHRLNDRVKFFGHLPRPHLVELYRRAAVLAFPSRFEGFGLPVLEAMAHGVPVAAARAASLPELVGDAGLLVDPEDILGWADALERLLDDDAERRRCADAGRRRAAEFAAPRSVDRQVAVYREVAERR